MPSVTQPQKKQAPERRRRSKIRPAYVVLILLMGLFAYKFVEKTQQIRRLTAQEVALQRQNQALVTSQNNTKADISRYHSSQYVQDTARSVLGLTKPGETLVQLQPTQPVVEHFRAAPARTPPPPEETWRQWWSTFFG